MTGSITRGREGAAGMPFVDAGSALLAPFQDIVAVSKVSGMDFLETADELWRTQDVLLLGDLAHAGIVSAREKVPEAGGGWWEGAFVGDADPVLAQISATSGTTGPPKAIALSRCAVSDTVARLVRQMEMDGGVREYIGVPVIFSFGLARARAVAAVGGAAFLPENGFRPDEIARMLAAGEINALSAVPTMLRTILAHPDLLGSAGQRLRWLEIGSQYMAAAEKRAVRDLFPNALILQHYGLTEASRSTFLRIDGASDTALETVGQTVDGGQMRIAQDGRIALRGPHLASGTITDGALVPLTDADGWLTTADLGEIRDGQLRYLGRADDVANIGGIKISAETFERALAERTGQTAGIGVCVLPDALRGEKLGIAVTPESLADTTVAAGAIAAERGLGQADFTIVALEPLPRTATGKLQRGQLAEAIAALDAADRALPTARGGGQDGSRGDTESSPLSGQSPRVAEIAAIWADALGLDRVDPDDSFHDLGGDSLSAVSVMIRAEQANITPEIMQRMFAGETVAQIAAALDGEGREIRADIRAVRADALNAVRGLFAMLIVVSHWGPFFVERMGAAGTAIWSVAAPVLRIGTPGFAMVYGMGLGLFFFGQIEKGQARLQRRVRSNTKLLLAGVLLVAGAQAWRRFATGLGFGPSWPEQLFYEVLLFYALMVPTSLFWLRRVASMRDRVFASLLLSIGAYAVFALASALMPVNPFTGWASLAWHMMVAPYSYPRLLGAVALGLAMALWLQRDTSREGLIRDSAQWGVALAGLGGLLILFVPGSWPAKAGEIVAIPAFAGIACLSYAGAASMASGERRPLVLKLAIVCGMLAFPIFIGHGIVMPIKAVLVAYGMAQLPATLMPAMIFVAIMLWLGRRIYSMMFATGKRRRRA